MPVIHNSTITLSYTSLVPRPHPQGSGDTQYKNLAVANEFVGHQSNLRSTKHNITSLLNERIYEYTRERLWIFSAFGKKLTSLATCIGT